MTLEVLQKLITRLNPTLRSAWEIPYSGDLVEHSTCGNWITCKIHAESVSYDFWYNQADPDKQPFWINRTVLG